MVVDGAPMRSLKVVVPSIFTQNRLEVLLVDDWHPVEALSATAPNQSLSVGIRPRRHEWGPNDSSAIRLEHDVGLGREFLVPIVERNTQFDALFFQLLGEIAGLLGHPGSARLGSAARGQDPARHEMHIYRDAHL